jgi:hypothetical protein
VPSVGVKVAVRAVEPAETAVIAFPVIVAMAEDAMEYVKTPPDTGAATVGAVKLSPLAESAIVTVGQELKVGRALVIDDVTVSSTGGR